MVFNLHSKADLRLWMFSKKYILESKDKSYKHFGLYI